MRRSAPFAAALALAVFTTSLLAADKATPGQKQYLAGVHAYDAADYGTAAGLFRAALAEDGSEGLAKFNATGLNKEDYLPHFYLGLSLEKLGQGTAAAAELKESQRQGAIRGRASATRILDSALSRLEAARIAALPPTPRPTPPPTVRPTATARPAPPPTRAPVPPAAPTALVEVRPTATPRAPRAAPSPAPAATRPAPPLPTEPLDETVAAAREGIRSYFKGDYAAAARQLEPLAPRLPAARLFLAYSLAGSQLLAPSRDEGVLARARREYETARSDMKKVDEALISPSVTALLRGSR
jgi:hypothetical protein